MPDDNSYAELDFNIALNSPRQRGRYRVDARGLSLHLDDVAQTFPLRDFSSTGCNLCAPAEGLTRGRIFNGTLYIGNVSYLADIKVMVVRHVADNSVACIFRSLTRQQEIMLDKLLLEMQKRRITSYATRRKREKTRCRHPLR